MQELIESLTITIKLNVYLGEVNLNLIENISDHGKTPRYRVQHLRENLTRKKLNVVCTVISIKVCDKFANLKIILPNTDSGILDAYRRKFQGLMKMFKLV